MKKFFFPVLMCSMLVYAGKAAAQTDKEQKKPVSVKPLPAGHKPTVAPVSVKPLPAPAHTAAPAAAHAAPATAKTVAPAPITAKPIPVAPRPLPASARPIEVAKKPVPVVAKPVPVAKPTPPTPPPPPPVAQKPVPVAKPRPVAKVAPVAAPKPPKAAKPARSVAAERMVTRRQSAKTVKQNIASVYPAAAQQEPERVNIDQQHDGPTIVEIKDAQVKVNDETVARLESINDCIRIKINHNDDNSAREERTEEKTESCIHKKTMCHSCHYAHCSRYHAGCSHRHCGGPCMPPPPPRPCRYHY